MSKRHTHGVGINIPMCIASILLCLTLFSLHMTCGIYARYTTTASSSDSARVITFGTLSIEESGDFVASGDNQGKMMLIPGVDIHKQAKVNFAGSESATYVFVEVELSNDWETADNKTFSIKSGSKTQIHWAMSENWTFLKNSANSYVYYRTLAPNTPLTEAEVIKDGKLIVSEQITESEIASMTDISIKFQASAVQSNGFENVDAAWTSLSAK